MQTLSPEGVAVTVDARQLDGRPHNMSALGADIFSCYNGYHAVDCKKRVNGKTFCFSNSKKMTKYIWLETSAVRASTGITVCHRDNK